MPLFSGKLSAEAIEAEYKRLDHTLGWSFMTCEEDRLDAADVALVTLNPAGAAFEAPHWASTNGSSYVHEVWTNPKPGKSPLQIQVQSLFEALEIDSDEVFSAYVVPFRSPRWVQLPNRSQSIQYSMDLWDEVLSRSPATRYVAFGKDVARMLGRIRPLRHICPPIQSGWGNQTLDVYTFGANARLLAIPHLSTYKIFSRSECAPAYRKAIGQLKS